MGAAAVSTSLRPWGADDELWYGYRDPWAEGAPSALERALALRAPNGWNVPFNGRTVFIADGTDENADAFLRQLRENGVAI